MALRAGYYGLKRFERNKLLDLAASIPADISPDNPIAGKNDVLATVDLLKDTTGWTGKNKLPNLLSSGTDSAGVTYTKNADGSVSMSASTISANTDRAIYDTRDTGVVNFLKGQSLVLYKGLEDTNVKMLINAYQDNSYVKTIVDLENGVVSQPFVLDYVGYNCVRITVYVKSTADLTTPKTIYPMICEKSVYDISPAYEPYHASVEDWYWSENAKTGAHNFLNTEKFETGAKDGITSTIRPDKGISLTGTPTIQSGTISFRNYGTILKAGTYKYKLNKKPKGSCIVGVNDNTSGLGNYKILAELRTNMTEISFTVTDEDLASKPYVFCELCVHSSAGTIDEVYYPQILLNEDTFGGFMPFAMTNRELTEMATTKDVTVTAGTDVTVNANTHVYSKAGVVTGSLRLEIGATLTAGATIATLGVKPKGTTYAIAIDNTDASVIPIIIGTNGAVQLFASFVPTEGHQLLIPISFIDDPGAVTNREISAEPEVKETKKATKKKVIKEEE